MKLEDIGFYTLSDERALNSSVSSPLYRCELIVTKRCNFKCPYCRGLINGEDLSLWDAKKTINYWLFHNLKNIRFSGGEPTLYNHLPELVALAKKGGVQNIAISTNGSQDFSTYFNLIRYGVNDFSISLDACCSSTGNTMSGKSDIWHKVIDNIKALSELVYVTVGVVLTEDNQNETLKIIELADSLGVSDIRVIPSAQHDSAIKIDISERILQSHPILKYRIESSRHVRGLCVRDSKKCKLVLDDMAVWNGEHYPCIIYLREQGKPIGKLNKNTRQDRFDWYKKHNSWNDKICNDNCLDVCIAFNNTAAKHFL